MRLVLLLLVLALTLPAVIWGKSGDVTSEAYDQNHHHLPVAHSFAEQLPTPDLRNYESATAPLWHLTLAALERYLDVGERGFRIINCIVGAMLVLVVASFAQRSAGSIAALCLALPLALSPYFLSGSIWVTTDVPALLAALAAIAFAMAAKFRVLPVGLGAAAAVGVRQVSLWIEAPLALAIYLRRLRSPTPGIAAVALALVPALAVIGWLVWMWNGLTPPGYRSMHDKGANPATIALALSLCALWGVPLLGASLYQIGPMFQKSSIGLMATVLGLVTALAVPTSFAMDSGRWGGPLWSAVGLAPTVAGRSLLLCLLAPIGALVVCAMFRQACVAGRGLEARVLAVALLAMITASSANSQCWERYLDLPLLSLLPWMAAVGARTSADKRMLMGGAIMLASAQAALSMHMVYAGVFPNPG